MVGVQKVMDRYFVLSWGDQKDIDRYLYFYGINKKISISFLVWDGQKDIERYLFWYGTVKKISNDIFLFIP